jgi:hypothetical protein
MLHLTCGEPGGLLTRRRRMAARRQDSAPLLREYHQQERTVPAGTRAMPTKAVGEVAVSWSTALPPWLVLRLLNSLAVDIDFEPCSYLLNCKRSGSCSAVHAGPARETLCPAFFSLPASLCPALDPLWDRLQTQTATLRHPIACAGLDTIRHPGPSIVSWAQADAIPSRRY